jgi:hypothetical protein
MANKGHREEVINTCLAILMARHGVDAEAETIHRSGRQRPDVLFTLGGLRTVIEGKYADVADADKVVSGDAERRVSSGICHIAVAVVYPKELRTAGTRDIEKSLAAARLRYRIFSETGNDQWLSGTPSEILAALRRVHGALVKDDVVAESARSLSEKIENIAALWSGQPATCDRLSDILGMPAKRGETADEREGRRTTATKVASLVLANALIFQEQLASSGGDGRVDSLRAYDNEPDPIDSLKSHWRWIWGKINYIPIFQLGERILAEIPVSSTAIASVRWLMQEAKAICANQSALRHDLMGRIYHWMLYHAKYLGTYYTSTAAATMLLKLTFAQAWNTDFGSPRKLADFVVTDLTCGTGTLLMAAAQAITDKFIVSRFASERMPTELDLKHLHETLMENVLWGYDVLASAVHLTASTLGMLAPNVTYRKMNLYVLPMGVEGRTSRLGSLDFIGRNRVETQLALDNSQLEAKKTSVANEYYAVAELPEIDLCVMNPPFVRSVGGNLLFGSLPDDERDKLQTELKKRAKDLPASITAGLGSVYMAIADRRLRDGGRMAFVLPVALATGEAWGINRKMIADGYHLETVIASHDGTRPNFSENTSLSEIMFVARKLKKKEAPGNTAYINLWHNPRTIYEAMDVSDRVNARTGNGAVLSDNGRKLAEVIELPPAQGEDQWIGVQFAQSLTLRAAAALGRGRLEVPGRAPADVPLCPLGELGAIGPDRKRIHEGFKVSQTDWSPYSSFWNHDARKVKGIAQKPNSWLVPWEQSPRGPDYGQRRLWPRAGRVLLVERLWPITHRVLAVGFTEPVLGNTWWALKSELSSEQEKALLLWLNSSPSLLMFLSRRVATRSAWMQVKQPQWERMPVLDVRALDAATLSRLAGAFDEIAGRELMALAKLNVDETRAAIDAALSVALGLPDFAPLRALLAREPGLTGISLSPEPGQGMLIADSQEAISTQLRLI